ncbi:MAG: TlpA family protein disulfide reductase [Gammaproteobacteria bacterium]|nr:TlpA family protein disulfide reductase [Gammaproteobacteria bacterium]MBQ0840313.1 TlpA family protein disulfide reductase [Gammaproteobacteria bacterium]
MLMIAALGAPMLRRKIKTLLLLMSLSLLCGCGVEASRYDLLGGGSVSFEELRGKVVLINYWAQWCRPCRIEIPELNHFAQQHPDSVRVLSVNFDGVVGEALSDQVQALGIEFDTLLQDPRHDLAVPASGGLPETIVLNPRGEVQQVLLGPQTRQSLEAILRSSDL